MPRYLVQRTFHDGLELPLTPDGASASDLIVQRNLEERVTWVRSFVTIDRHTTYCVYDGPSPEAVRRAARRNGQPVDRITEVRVLDPSFYF